MELLSLEEPTAFAVWLWGGKKLGRSRPFNRLPRLFLQPEGVLHRASLDNATTQQSAESLLGTKNHWRLEAVNHLGDRPGEFLCVLWKHVDAIAFPLVPLTFAAFSES
jgi:hypothetical protein